MFKKYCSLLIITMLLATFVAAQKKVRIISPYEGVNWQSVQRHKGNLHTHTLQSDGYHRLKTVTQAYKRAGYTVLAITDHDWNWPNARLSWKHVTEEEATPYPLGRLPKNYPANTTWPWKNYGSPSPEELGMVGIEAGELTFRHHINSYFCDYGVWYERTGSQAPYGGIVDSAGREVFEDDQIAGVKQKGGLAILNHPGIPSKNRWWDRKPLDWYVERFRNNGPECLVGMEVTNNTDETAIYDESLWDQLLARFMPRRPIWGFGNDDMHTFETGRKGDHDGSQNTFTVFLLDTLSLASVRSAMEKGNFYSCKSTRQSNLQYNDLDLFPSIESIGVDQKRGVISVKATNYDRIRWITSPSSLQPVEDFRTSNQPWPGGVVVSESTTLNCLTNKAVKGYVRIELERSINGHIYKTFSNPIGIEEL